MPLIVPSTAFEAYMTSLRVIAIPDKLHSFLQIPALKMQSLEAIMTVASMGSTIYIRDGEKCYFSDKLRHELWITDGELNNHEGEPCFVTIDF